MDFLTLIGIKVPDLIAGIAGGMVNAILFQRSAPWAAAASVVAGGLTANYMAEPTAKMFAMNVGPAGFVIGLTAMIVCQGLMAGAQKWASSKGTTDDVRP